jgi:RHS repeat-associated protein
MITYDYDENGNCISMVDTGGQTTLSYDGRNRMISEIRTIDGQPYTVSYAYDATSKITGMIYPDQTSISYVYDALNRVTSIPGYAEFNYNPEGLLSSMTYTNGVVTAYSYDDNDRPLSIHAHKDGIDLLMMAYQYDSNNNITQLDYSRLKDGQWTESTETFSYDWLDRLVSVQGSSGSVSYSYDAVGNRIMKNDLTYTYNDMNELLSMSDGTSFTYDQLGNTATKSDEDSWTYTCDIRNRLTQVEKNQQAIALYDYDGNGRRVKKTEWSEDLQAYKATICMYSGLDIIYEKDADSDAEAIYIYSPRGRIAKSVDGLKDYYHSDFLGSTRLITDENGTVTSETQYKAFGKNESNEKSHLYTGKEKDSSELYYFGSRYYDFETGRFITRDTRFGRKSTPQSFNRYIYCLNNPLKYIDPDGRENSSWLFDQEQENKKVLCYSQAPQLIEYVYLEYDYTAFAYYCIISGIILGIAGAIFSAPYLMSFAKTLASLSSVISNKIIGIITKIVDWYKNLPRLAKWVIKWGVQEFIRHCLVRLYEFIQQFEDNIEDIDVEFFSLGIIFKFLLDNGIITGMVQFLWGDTYYWKFEDNIYFVLIDGEWVEMPEGWKPGDPIPNTEG